MTLNEGIARVAHAVNNAYREALGEPLNPAWDDAPEHMRNSALDGVRFHLENPDAGPEASHENWRKFKEADGWTFDTVRNDEAKVHPCMLPFNELPVAQRAKDHIFQAVVHSMTSRASPQPVTFEDEAERNNAVLAAASQQHAAAAPEAEVPEKKERHRK